MNCETFYESQVHSFTPSPPLEENTETDIVIVGGGLAGLSLAFELASQSANFVLLEGNEVAKSASGRNGGFCSPGWAAADEMILKIFGNKSSKDFCELSLEGIDWVKSMSGRSGFENIELTHGTINLSITGSTGEAEGVLREKKSLYGDTFEIISQTDLNTFVNSKMYKYGLLSNRSFHINPLKFLLALKTTVISQGGKIFENSRMESFYEVDNKIHVRLSNGKCIEARRLIIATGGYAGTETGFLRSRWLPISTCIAVTADLGAPLHEAILKNFAFSDNRRAGNYFRKLTGNRLLWGRDISAFNIINPQQICARTGKDLKLFFPELIESIGGLEKLKFDFLWSGMMAYSVSALPYVREISPNLYALTGFGGHGLNTATVAAKIMSEHLLGLSDRIKIFKKIPLNWNGSVLGPYAAETYYQWHKFKERQLYFR